MATDQHTIVSVSPATLEVSVSYDVRDNGRTRFATITARDAAYQDTPTVVAVVFSASSQGTWVVETIDGVKQLVRYCGWRARRVGLRTLSSSLDGQHLSVRFHEWRVEMDLPVHGRDLSALPVIMK